MIDAHVDWSKYKGKNTEKSKQAYIKLFDVLNKHNHKLVGDYINSTTKVLIDFNCGHEPHWIDSRKYKSGKRCPKCFGNCTKQAQNNFYNLIKANNHKLLSGYRNNKTKVLIDFNCGHEPHWIRPDHYMDGVVCPKCIGRNGQSEKDFIIKLNKNNHILLSEYINESTKVLIDFNCGHEPHWIRPGNYKNGNRCPLCKNKGEAALHRLLLDVGFRVEIQKTSEDLKDRDHLKYDFYLPEHNLLIELDGDHHRKLVAYKTKNMTELERGMAELDAEIRFYDRQRKDKLKDEYARDNNIPLLRIEYNKSKVELDRWKQLILDKIGEIKNEQELCGVSLA